MTSCLLSQVHPAGIRHEARAGADPAAPRVGAGEAQAAHHRERRQGQLRAAAAPEKVSRVCNALSTLSNFDMNSGSAAAPPPQEPSEGAAEGRQDHRRLDLHRRHQHGRHEARRRRPRHRKVAEDQRCADCIGTRFSSSFVKRVREGRLHFGPKAAIQAIQHVCAKDKKFGPEGKICLKMI